MNIYKNFFEKSIKKISYISSFYNIVGMQNSTNKDFKNNDSIKVIGKRNNKNIEKESINKSYNIINCKYYNLDQNSNFDLLNINFLNKIYASTNKKMPIIFMSKNNYFTEIKNFTDFIKKNNNDSNNSILNITIYIHKAIIDYSGIFNNCLNLKTVTINNNTNNKITTLKNGFSCCTYLVNVSFNKLNTENMNNLSKLFFKCKNLVRLLGISNWDTSNITDISNMFSECCKLISLPDISNWNTSNVTNMSNMFSNCSGLTSLPDISKWNTSKITKISNMFYGCSNLTSLPNIFDSKLKKNFREDIRFNDIFNNCQKLNINLYKNKISLSEFFIDIIFLNIKTIKGESFIFCFKENDTIYDIKKKISEEKKCDSDRIMLFSSEKQLENNKTLEYYKFKNNTLHLALTNN